MSQPINVGPGRIEQTAQTIAATISQAARPGPVPQAIPGTPADSAAAAVAGAVTKNVAAASAELAPKSAEGLTLTEAAVTGAQAKDDQNAGRIKAVPADMRDRVQMVRGAGVQPAD
jgi:hypothetical protein